MVQYGEFNEIQIDVLKEIGNIGAGNAATALATMMALPIDMTVPKVNMLPAIQVKNWSQIPGGYWDSHCMDFYGGDLEGIIMFLLEKEFTHTVINNLLGSAVEDFSQLSEMDLSVIQEIGNILSASYINSIASLTGLNINISVPAIAVDMAGAILSVPAIKYGEIGDEVLLIEGAFIGNTEAKEEVSTKLILILEEKSLNTLMERLGVS